MSVQGGCYVEQTNKGEDLARKPVIGVAAGVPVGHGGRQKLLQYMEAIERAGGEPRELPLTTDGELLCSAMSEVDALLMTGGRDVHPGMYGEEVVGGVKLKEESPERLERDKTCLTYAKESGMPVLAICYGMQLLDVVEGGTLHQDIGADILPFHRASDKDYVEHEVVIERGTLLERVIGARRINVRSSHHQAVRKPGAGMVVSARSAEGDVIEAIEGEGAFLLGVQWHPERHERQPDPIFAAFVEAASAWAIRCRE